jgi:hypothetical protein
MTSVNAQDITEPGGMQRLLDSATEPEGRTAIMCEAHVPSVEMQRLDDAAVCPECKASVRLVWVENE